MVTAWLFLILLTGQSFLWLSESFNMYQQPCGLPYSTRSRGLYTSLPITSRLNAKGFGSNRQTSNDEGVKNGNNDNIDDILLQTIAAKEAEFQAELDKMLAEAKANNALAGKSDLDGFSNEDLQQPLSKAIVEMQQLRKQQKSRGSDADEEITVSDDGYQIVKLIIPPGLRAGEVMVVQLRNGMFEIEVPDGVQEGDEIEVVLPA